MEDYVFLLIGLGLSAVVVAVLVLQRRSSNRRWQDANSEYRALVDSHTPVAYSVEPGMTEEKFWSLIDQSWQDVDPQGLRAQWLAGAADDSLDEIEIPAQHMVANLAASLDLLQDADLIEFDRILELQLYELDSEGLADEIEGGDDSFLYMRGLFVALGKDYMARVVQDPTFARAHVHLEEICYLPVLIYSQRHGDVSMPETGICRETGSNTARWN